MSKPPAVEPRPTGILTVTLLEGAGLSRVGLSGGHERNHHAWGRPVAPQRHHLPYAVLDYEGSQVFIECYSGSIETPLWNEGHRSIAKFDVTRSAKLTIHLYLDDPDAPRGYQGVYMGMDGTGKIHILLENTDVENKVLESLDFKYERIIDNGYSAYLQVIKKDTQRAYAEKILKAADQAPHVKEAFTQHFQITHPFIAPLKFVFESEESLHLIFPFVSGGYLFDHLQGARRFDFNTSRLYTVEILCALENLHAHNIFPWLKPQNTRLDSLGHVVLCGFGLFNLENENGSYKNRGMSEYPAPELLLDQKESRTADWWTVGVFLFEMLTGLPLFYDEDSNNIRSKVLNQPIELPHSLPLVAKDIITKLLDRRPEQRLGAKGASEIKSHPLFEGIEWEKVFQRKYDLAFKPGKLAEPYKQHGAVDPSEPSLWAIPQATAQDDDGCERVWEEASKAMKNGNQELAKALVQKHDRVTLSRALGLTIDQQDVGMARLLLENGVLCDFEETDRPLPRHPLDNGFYSHDLSKPAEFIPPLVRAVTKDNPDLVRLLLSHGADVNAGYHDLGCSNGREPVVFSCGRVIQLAMELGLHEIVQLLLASGANIDLQHPVWPVLGHDCQLVPRPVYLRVTAGLRAAVAVAKTGK